jgi:DNA invertase Pin-like site-specific DNA recombinase
VFTDKASGKDTQRPELERLLAFVREGDTVVVHSMDRWRATSMTCAASCKG